ncbi:MAG: hypothetical protein K0U24_03545 [Gammaproteobacteria bacterium]|nr:hypothetical protein [Gammaproteobacteria bacterium]
MKRSAIKTCVQKAHTLHLDNSGLSLTEKSNRFARFFAYEVAASGFPKHGDRAGCIAANHTLNLVQRDYEYALNRERTSAQLMTSKRAYERACGIYNSDESEYVTAMDKTTPIDEMPEPILRSHVSHKNQLALDGTKADYMKAYCMAFILFEEAAKTQTQAAFEKLIEKTLNHAFADPYSYSSAFFQLMMRTEVSTIMSISLVLGLVALALPGTGFSALAVETTYAIGGSMAASGAAYHTWRFFAKPSGADDAVKDEVFIPQTI